MRPACRVLEPFEARVWRHFVPRPHVEPDKAAAFNRGVRGNVYLLPVRLSFDAVRQVNALAVHVELPAVVDAAQTVFFVSAKEERRATMRAISIETTDTAIRVAKGNQLLAQQA